MPGPQWPGQFDLTWASETGSVEAEYIAHPKHREATMSFSTASILKFAADKNVLSAEVEAIKSRAREAAQDFGGEDGEFSGGRLNFVLGRELAAQFEQAREGNSTRYGAEAAQTAGH